jgi:hypothetical protein
MFSSPLRASPSEVGHDFPADATTATSDHRTLFENSPDTIEPSVNAIKEGG